MNAKTFLIRDSKPMANAQNMRLCFGGSFNPIHFGHLRCAEAAARARGFAAVLLIPSAQPPHKPDSIDLAPAADRLAMARLGAEYMNTQNANTQHAAAGNPPPQNSPVGFEVPVGSGVPVGFDVPTAFDLPVSFDVDDIELRRSGPSYTIDTTRELRRRGWSRVCWLIGADMLNYFPRWHEADKLVNEAEFLVMARPGHQLRWDQLPPAFARLRENVVAVPAIDVSATEIRQRVRKHQSIAGLTPPAVIDYILQHQLYG